MRIKTRISLFLERSLLKYFSSAAKRRRPRRKTGKILIARTDGVGDYILWLSVERHIRGLYPDSHIEMVFDDRKPTPQLARHDPWIDSYFSLPIVTWRRFWSVYTMLNKEYDIIIQPVYSRLAMTDILLFAAKAHVRITIDTNGQYLTKQELKWSNSGYDVITAALNETRHELFRCAELLHGLGMEDVRACLPDISCLNIEKKKLADNYIMIFPSASWSGKIWEKEKYVKVIRWLMHKFSGKIYLCGDYQDREICQWIADSVNQEECLNLKLGSVNQKGRLNLKSGSGNQSRRLSSIAGKIDLVWLTAYIKGARAVIGNDTGAIHIAAACRVPSLAVVAQREIGRFMPYQTDYEDERKYYPVCVFCAGIKCSGCIQKGISVCHYQPDLQKALPCIRKISAKQVIEALEALLFPAL